MRRCRFRPFLLVGLALCLASCAPETATSSKSPAGKSRVIVLTEKNFDEEVLKSAKPVLVDFWAPWCGPCRLIAPTVETLSVTHAGMLKVGKLNIDDADDLAAEYGAHKIPLLILFRDGKEVGRMPGAPRDNTETVITAWVEETLAAK
jgi:thioredoxin 1